MSNRRFFRAAPRGPLIIPGGLLLASCTWLLALMHLRSLGWAPGMLHHEPRGYWQTVADLVGAETLYASKRAAVANWHFALLAIALMAASASYVWAVLRARRQPERIRLRPILLGVALCAAPLLIWPNLFSGDIYSYIMFGRVAAVYEANPFTTTPASFPHDPYLSLVYWKQVPSVYGPAWVMLSHLITLLAEPLGGLWAYQLAYKLAATLAHMLNVVLIWQILGRWQSATHRQGWGTLLYAWNPLVLIEFAANAHNDVWMITLLLATVWLHLHGRLYLALASLVGAVLVKWVALPLVPLYGLMVLRQAGGWRRRAWLIVSGLGLAAAMLVVGYLPYWTGPQTLAVLAKAPPSTRTINSLADMAANELLYQRHLRGQGFSPWPPPPPSSPVARVPMTSHDDQGLAELLRAERQVQEERSKTYQQGLQRLKADRAALDARTRMLANLLLLGTWIFWAVRVRDLETLLRSWAWVLLVYTVTAVWFWPWYATWFVAMAALLPWRRFGVTSVLLAGGALLIYATYPRETPPLLHERLRALLVFGPALMYLASTLLPGRRADSDADPRPSRRAGPGALRLGGRRVPS